MYRIYRYRIVIYRVMIYNNKMMIVWINNNNKMNNRYQCDDIA